MTNGATIIWVDVNGRTRATYIKTASGSSAITTQLAALSHGDLQNAWEGTLFVNGSPITSVGSYQNVADYAQLIYSTASGDLVYLTLVAPQSSIFLADQETVDVAALAALNTAVIGNLTDASGNVVTVYVGGLRRRSGREYQ